MSGRERRPPLPVDACDALRAARQAKRWSYRRAAAACGLTCGYLHALENGQRCPSLTVAIDLADALGLAPAMRARLLDAAVRDAGRDWIGPDPDPLHCDSEGAPHGPL